MLKCAFRWFAQGEPFAGSLKGSSKIQKQNGELEVFQIKPFIRAYNRQELALNTFQLCSTYEFIFTRLPVDSNRVFVVSLKNWSSEENPDTLHQNRVFR